MNNSNLMCYAQPLRVLKQHKNLMACFSWLHYYINPQELETTLIKFKKFLKPNGNIYISLKEGDNTEKVINERYFYFWDTEHINKVLKKSGYKGELFFTSDKKTHEVQKEQWLNLIIKQTPTQTQNKTPKK